jgi:hypothetical protein
MTVRLTNPKRKRGSANKYEMPDARKFPPIPKPQSIRSN